MPVGKRGGDREPVLQGLQRLPARWLLWAVNSTPQVAPCAVLRFDKRRSHAACVRYDAVCWADALLCFWWPRPSEWVAVDPG